MARRPAASQRSEDHEQKNAPKRRDRRAKENDFRIVCPVKGQRPDEQGRARRDQDCARRVQNHVFGLHEHLWTKYGETTRKQREHCSVAGTRAARRRCSRVISSSIVFRLWHGTHRACAFPKSSAPPSHSGRTWSTWKHASRVSPHAAHVHLWRAPTCRLWSAVKVRFIKLFF